jgi:hypothetical protein
MSISSRGPVPQRSCSGTHAANRRHAYFRFLAFPIYFQRIETLSAALVAVSAIALLVCLLVRQAVLLLVCPLVSIAGNIAPVGMLVSLAILKTSAQGAVTLAVIHSVLEPHLVPWVAVAIAVGISVVIVSVSVIVTPITALIVPIALIVTRLVRAAVVIIVGMRAILVITIPRTVLLPMSQSLLIVRVACRVLVPILVMAGAMLIALL